MMPVQQPSPEIIRMNIEMRKARLNVVNGQRKAYSGLLDQLPAGAVLNGLQVVAGEEVREIPTDALRAVIESHTAALDMEAEALSGEITGLERLLPGHVLLARSRPLV